MKKSLLAGLACLLFVQAHNAQAGDLDNYLELPPEALLNIKVTTASKREEKLSEAPGIVSVITHEDIERYGANNLMEVISRFPNMNIVYIPLMPTGMGGDLRGQVPEAIPNHILTLIDGRPFRESQLGGYSQTIYQSFPLEQIDKIELIRGPGSVLYGTGAFSGVINIITKKPENIDRQEEKNNTYLSAGYGSFNSKFEEASYRKYDEKHDLSISGATKYFGTSGWDYAMTDKNGIYDATDLSNDAASAYLRGKYKNFTVTGYNARTKTTAFNALPSWPIGSHTQHWHFMDVGYMQAFSQNWEARFNVTYNGFSNDASTPSSISDKNVSENLLYEAALSGSLTEKINLLLGATYEDRRGALKISGTNYENALEGYYVQTDYRPVDWLKLVGGLQLNKPETTGKYDLSPRAGAIISFTPTTGAKLLYGEAFRAPTAGETSLNIPGAIGNKNLKSEKIATREAQIFYDNSHYFTALTYYESTIRNAIYSGPNPNAPPAFTFLNGDKQKYSGVELEGKAFLNDSLEIQGSLTYQKGKDPSTNNQDITLAPHLMFKMGGSYNWGNMATLGIFNQHVADTVGYPTATAPTAKPNPEVTNTNLLTANLSVNVNDALNLPGAAPQIKFNLYGDNLLDENIYVPEVTDGIGLNTIPSHSGRAVYASFNVRF